MEVFILYQTSGNSGELIGEPRAFADLDAAQAIGGYEWETSGNGRWWQHNRRFSLWIDRVKVEE